MSSVLFPCTRPSINANFCSIFISQVIFCFTALHCEMQWKLSTPCAWHFGCRHWGTHFFQTAFPSSPLRLMSFSSLAGFLVLFINPCSCSRWVCFRGAGKTLGSSAPSLHSSYDPCLRELYLKYSFSPLATSRLALIALWRTHWILPGQLWVDTAVNYVQYAWF